MLSRTIRVVIHCEFRGLDNRRRVANVYEVTGYRRGQFERHVLWERTPDDRLVRRNRPECLDSIAAAGIPYLWPGDAEP